MKHFSFTKLLPTLAFLIIFLGFSYSAHAANFSCVNSVINNDNATLTVDGTNNTTSNIDSDRVVLLQGASQSAIAPTQQADGSKENEQLFTFTSLYISTPYRVIVLDANNNYLEEITTCDFTTKATASTTSTQSSDVVVPYLNNGTPQCPATAVTTDACYEQACTGQASEDSSSCNAYAASVVTRDDGGDTTCQSISNSNEASCCPDNGTDPSPMCVAYENYTSKDAAAESGVAPGLVTNNTSSGIVSPDGEGLIPCDGVDPSPCTVNSVIQLMDNLMNFFFKTLLLPIFVVMIMYLGFSYLTAQGKPGQHAKVLSMAQHMVLGLLLILCAWLIVHTILSILGYTDTFGFFGT